ncbi:glycosyltransferase [Maribacter sp. 2304DJ31-5]|uniref:glycosyltransferase n=1 Tax=Maribacter sp. 2304DJ31-5 TaxID=3386273 RepID=UPI0039BCF67B
MNTSALCIIIPCYNEYERLPEANFRLFLEQTPHVTVCFVNDGSSDKTSEKLFGIQKEHPKNALVIHNEMNLGKAEAIRTAVLELSKSNNYTHFAYLDADLATSLEECYSLLQKLVDGKEFVFASRILKIGSIVERKFSRFLFGRIIATFISNILDIAVYDTQCGCKVFTSSIAPVLFNKPFISKWLFDVELFSRLLCHYGKDTALAKMEEIPVKRWVDQGDSKVKLSYFFRLWYDLFQIGKAHRKNYKTNNA